MTDLHANETPRPCPWCGGENQSVVEGTSFRYRRVECGCGVLGPEVRRQTLGEGSNDEWDAQARVDAVHAWNVRAAE